MLGLHETEVPHLTHEFFDVIFSFCTCLLLSSITSIDPFRYQTCQPNTETHRVVRRC